MRVSRRVLISADMDNMECSNINPLWALDLSHRERLVTVAVLIIVHVAWTFVSSSGVVEFGSAASALRALRNLAQNLAVGALLD